MNRPSLYSSVITTIAVIAWAYILSLTYLPAGWDAILGKLMEMSPEAMWGFFESIHQFLIHLAWVVIVIHVGITIIPSINERFNPRWTSHVAVLALVWLAFVQATFAPAAVHSPTQISPPAQKPGFKHP